MASIFLLTVALLLFLVLGALSAPTVWELRSTGSDTNAGGFNVGNANFATDLAATSANTSAPVVTSASYTFLAGDAGSLLFIKAGTNWIPGFYPIASVNAGAATLNAAIGAANLYGGATVLNTVAGVATVASPTTGTWSVDYSQQDAAGITFTDLVIDGTTNTDFTSAAHPIGKNMVGNLANVTSGTGFTVQRVEVVSVTGTTGRADKSLGTLSSTGGNGKLGGALGAFGSTSALAASMIGSNLAFVRGSFSVTTSATFAAPSVAPSNTVPYTRLVGYSAYRGDGGRATITVASGAVLPITLTNGGWAVHNLSIDGGTTGTIAVFASGANTRLVNCKLANLSTCGVQFNGNYSGAFGCEVTGLRSGATFAIVANSDRQFVYDCNIHDNVCSGINVGNQAVSIQFNLITNNTGASSDGMRLAQGCVVFGNTVYGSGRHGIVHNVDSANVPDLVQRNILSENGKSGTGYGLVGGTAAGCAASFAHDGNAYYLNATGARNFADDAGAVNPVNGVAPYVNSLDVILSADPFTNKAGNDFTLNATVGGGAACRGAGVPTSWPGSSIAAYPDMGAVQHQEAAPSSGGGSSYVEG